MKVVLLEWRGWCRVLRLASAHRFGLAPRQIVMEGPSVIDRQART